MGRAIGKDTLVYVKNTQSVERTAQTVIHEVTHSGLEIAGSQRAEIIAFMRAAKHTNPNLSFGDIRSIINEVKALYPDLPYRIGR